MTPSWQLSRETWISAEPGTRFCRARPEPHRDALERRHFEAFDLVQKPMVERVVGVRDGGGQVIEMEDEAGLCVGLAVDDDARANEWPCTREFGWPMGADGR